MNILIDGENFRHQIAEVLVAKKLIKEKNEYFAFDIAAFFKKVVDNKNIEITYYTTKIKKPAHKVPLKLSNVIDKISVANRKWVAQLNNQNIRVIKAGHLRVRESSSCVHCSKKTLVLQEKGVDVRVATDLVLLSKKDQLIGLVSSDSDLTPALQAAKQIGANVEYICYAGKLNRSVAACASKVITFKDSDIEKFFRNHT